MKTVNYIKPIGALLFFSFFLTLSGCFNKTSDGKDAVQVQKDLETEFAAIGSLPEAASCECKSSHKSSQALVFCKYSTDLTYREIRNYYDSELAKRGWRFKTEEPIRDWGRDFGGKNAKYCKGAFEASIEYFGEDSRSYGANYALNLSWGLESLNEKWNGTACQ